MKKDGVELLYFAVTSDRSARRDWGTDSGENHHHLIVNEEAKEYIMAAWKAGGVDWKPMGAQPDYTGIVAYLLRQVRKVRKDKNAYKSSRNLKRPQAEDRLHSAGQSYGRPKGQFCWTEAHMHQVNRSISRYILPSACEEDDVTEAYGIKRASAAIQHKKEHKRKGGRRT